MKRAGNLDEVGALKIMVAMGKDYPQFPGTGRFLAVFPDSPLLTDARAKWLLRARFSLFNW